MEYGLRIASPESSAVEDWSVAGAEWGADALQDIYTGAPLTALYFGSEFCQELIPGISDLQAFCALCDQRSLEAVLLTPVVTHRGLERIDRLLGKLTGQGWNPAVVFNDWGVFHLLHKSYPDLPLRMGRLMNRGLRDPRLAMQPMAGGENTARGDGLRKLARRLGVYAVETDADLEPGYLGNGDDGVKRTLHLPFTFVASGRNCLEKAAAAATGQGAFTRGLKSGCSAPCRGICRVETRSDTQYPLWRSGNTLFFTPPQEWVSRHLVLADRLVLHQRPMP